MKDNRIKFHIGLTGFIIVSILLGAVSMTLISQYVGNKAALVSARNLFNEVSVGVSQDVNHFFQSIVNVTETMSYAPVMDSASPRGEFDDKRIAYMRRVLDMNTQFSSLYVGSENGDFVQTISFKNAPKMRGIYMASQDAAYLCRVISNAHGRKLQLWQYYDAQGHPLDVRVEGNPAYDPRQRPWYKEARAEAGGAVFTSPYVFSSSKVLGITCAVTLPGGKMVLGADITIDKLDTILGSYRLSEHAKLLLIDKAQRVISNPNAGGGKP